MSGKKYFVFLVILVLTIAPGMVGCGQKSSPQQKPQSSSAGQKPKAPKSAEAILKDINTLIGDLDQINKSKKTPWLAQKAQQTQSDQGQGGSNGQGASGNSGQGGNSSGGSQNGASNTQSGSSGGGSGSSSNTGGQTAQKPDQAEMQWQKITKSLMNIHRKWNELEPDAIEAGLPVSSREGFEQALSRLTQTVSEQKTEESLTAAIDLYEQYTAGLSQIFTLSTPPELYQVEYRTMAALAAANRQDWTAASDAIMAVTEPWGLLKAQAKKADKKLLSRCDFSLQDLKKAIDAQDLSLVMIKGEIASSNLKELEKSLTSNQQ